MVGSGAAKSTATQSGVAWRDRFDVSKTDLGPTGTNPDLAMAARTIPEAQRRVDTWRAGVEGARLGLMIPAKPTVGQAFYQEIAPKVAMDRVEVVSTDEIVKTPAGIFEHCVHLRETTPLEGDVSHKYYAAGIGMIKDDEFELAERPGTVR